MSDVPLEDHDLMVFGIYSDWKLFTDVLEPFDLSFDFDPSIVEEEEEETEWFDYVEDDELIPQDDSLDFETAEPQESTESEEIALLPSENLVDEEEQNGEEGVKVNIVEIPDFGTLATNGVGLILFRHESDQNILILLAETIEEVGLLAELINAGELYGCAMLNQIALCNINSSGYYDY
ncbi:MAG: hypothetical protein MUO76_11380 [Anaerolineaceae bacterium]|nr:hypothetical protein [Anaerolineaceae bacterium]